MYKIVWKTTKYISCDEFQLPCDEDLYHRKSNNDLLIRKDSKMKLFIKKIFWPPIFDDEDKSRKAANLNALLWISLTLLTALRIFSYLFETNTTGENFFTNPITIVSILNIKNNLIKDIGRNPIKIIHLFYFL